MDYLEQGLAPNSLLINEIISESEELFKHAPVTPQVLRALQMFLDERVKEEIAKGNFRERVVFPNNRWATFHQLRLVQDEEDHSHMKVIPTWMYDDEPEEGYDE
jgi:hypothetical protein